MTFKEVMNNTNGKGVMGNWFMWVAPFIVVLGAAIVALSIIYNVRHGNILGGMLIGGAGAPFFLDLSERSKE